MVSVILIVCILYVFLSVCLFVLCLTVLVNCLLNLYAIFVGDVNVFSLKVIGLFLGCAIFWLIRLWSSKEYVCCVCGPSVCV